MGDTTCRKCGRDFFPINTAGGKDVCATCWSTEQRAQPCELCKEQCGFTDGSLLSPSDVSSMKLASRDVEATVFHSFAVSMIVWDNPPGSADNKMWFVCSRCLAKHFSAGSSLQNISAMRRSLDSTDREAGGTFSWACCLAVAGVIAAGVVTFLLYVTNRIG